MSRLSTVIGMLTAAMISGHAHDHRDARLPARSRDAPPPRAIPAQGVNGMPPADTASRDGGAYPLVPVAIDSETGEPCCVSASQASLMLAGRRVMRRES